MSATPRQRPRVVIEIDPPQGAAASETERTHPEIELEPHIAAALGFRPVPPPKPRRNAARTLPTPRLTARDHQTSGADLELRRTPISFGPRLRLGGSIPPGTVVGGYVVIEEIARGGMGVVCRARQPELGREVALKLLIAGALADEQSIRRFLHEAELVSQLEHPAICRVYDVGYSGGSYYQAMELIDGLPLNRWLAVRERSVDEILRVLIEACHGIHHAHLHGVIHRDIKPANLMVDREGHARVLDFGVAKSVNGTAFGTSDESTRSDAIVGTPYYMPPEQAAGRAAAVDLRADIYALGAVLYDALAGRPPFAELNPQEFLLRVMVAEPEPISSLRNDLPRDLVRVVDRCLQKDPANRYQSALELAHDLERIRRGQPITARSEPVLRRLAAWRRRHPRAAALILWFTITSAFAAGASALSRLSHAQAAHLALERARTEIALARKLVADYRNRRHHQPDLGLREARTVLQHGAAQHYREGLDELEQARSHAPKALDLAALATRVEGELAEVNALIEDAVEREALRRVETHRSSAAQARLEALAGAKPVGEVRRRFEETLRTDPTDRAARFGLAFCQAIEAFERGERGDGRRHLERAALLAPDPLSRLHLALARRLYACEPTASR